MAKRKNPQTRDDSAESAPLEQEYYNRLLHQCRKDLSKQLKVCKSFECQKLIRRIKMTEKDSSKMQQSYDHLKSLPIDPILNECFRRLGVLRLNPGGHQEPPNDDSMDPKWTDKLLEHKRMQQALERWSGEVTEFRKWCVRRQEIDEASDGPVKRQKGKHNPEAKKPSDRSQNDTASNSLFVQLGGGEADSSFPAAKKNRPGQRARKAKAAAIEARQKGMPIPKSLNWRENKTSTEGGSKDSKTTSSGAKIASRDNASSKPQSTMKPAAPTENIHPSWQAQKSKKEGIVAFQGKKITFD